MSVDPYALLAIVGMGVVTYLLRASGIFIGGRLNLEGRARAAFEAIPPAVLMAVIAPTVFATGWRESIAALVTVLAATRLPLLATVVIGVGTVVLLRLI